MSELRRQTHVLGTTFILLAFMFIDNFSVKYVTNGLRYSCACIQSGPVAIDFANPLL